MRRKLHASCAGVRIRTRVLKRVEASFINLKKKRFLIKRILNNARIKMNKKKEHSIEVGLKLLVFEKPIIHEQFEDL